MRCTCSPHHTCRNCAEHIQRHDDLPLPEESDIGADRYERQLNRQMGE